MSSFASRSLRVVVFGLAVPALAADLVLAPPKGTAIVPPRDDLPPAVSQRQTTEAPTLRCWQEGRLVMEQAGVNLAEKPPGALVFRKKDRNGAPVYVFDMKNGLCVLSHEAFATEPVR
jgi:hypothetical protein